MIDEEEDELGCCSCTGDELRDAVRAVVWEPVEPFFLWLARKFDKWLI